MSAEKAKRTVLGIEIPRDELALRIMIACTGARPPVGTKASDALAELNALNVDGGMPMGNTFRAGADAAVQYLYECINAARQPS